MPRFSTRSPEYMATLTLTERTEEGDGAEVRVTVRGTVEPFVGGRYSGAPEDCYPDEGGCVDGPVTVELPDGTVLDPDATVARFECTAQELEEALENEAAQPDDSGDDYDPDDDRDDYPDEHHSRGVCW